MPFFTVIIPTYNRASLIKNAINSVLNQTFNDFELIIIDDGSTDNTKEVIESYGEEKIKYLFQENAERSVARNNGIKNSSGVYICFLDSDDEFKSNHLETFHSEISKNKNPICMIYSKVVSSDKLKMNYNKYEKILKYMIHPQEVCIHNTIFQQETFNESLRVVEDFDLWIRIVDKFPLFHINKETVIINDHEDRSVNYLKYNSYVLNLSLFKSIYSNSRFKGKISKHITKETLSDSYFGIAKYYLYNGKLIKGTYNMLMSISLNNKSAFRYKLNLILKGFINRKGLEDLLESE